jgi:hypothetical protein
VRKKQTQGSGIEMLGKIPGLRKHYVTEEGRNPCSETPLAYVPPSV